MIAGRVRRLGSPRTPILLRAASGSIRESRIQGIVEREVVILANGTAGPVRIIRSLDRGLDLKAIEAVRQWRFKPALFQSKPVDLLVEIIVDFNIL